MSQIDEVSNLPLDMPTKVERLGLGRRLLGQMMKKLQYGCLTVVLPTGAIVEKRGSEPGPEATIVLRRWRLLRRVAISGDIGFAEAYLDEDWTTPDLVALIRLAARNSKALSPAIKGNIAMRLVNRIGHLLNTNSQRGSRRNIEAHYDLGNDFYRQWLGPTMLYSSAIFDEMTSTLEAAQALKLDRIRQKLAMTGGESVLEIGCGWGALAIDMAEKDNADVLAITLSPSQLAWARTRAAASSRARQVDIRLQDYRDTVGQFDRIVSIEMFEAVGREYWPAYFATLKRCLKPGGRAVLQIISIEEQRYQSYRGATDFIQKYVFPGGFLPSDRALQGAMAAAGLKLADAEYFGKSYAQTLAQWRLRFHAHWPAITAQGFDERFKRLWNYYLCYCEAGFAEGSIDVGLYTIAHA